VFPVTRIQPLSWLILLAMLLLAAIVGAQLAPDKDVSRGIPNPKTLSLTRPTGAAYHSIHESVVVVGRHGEIGEFDREGRRRHLFSPQSPRTDLDLQGVTVDPLTGWLYVVDGSCYLIYEIDMDREPAEVRRTFELDAADVPVLRGRTRRTGGFTGICFLPPQGRERGGRFILTHQGEPAGLVEIELPLREPAPANAAEHVPARFVNWYDLFTDDLSDLTYDRETRTLLVLRGRLQELLWVSLDGRDLGRLRLPRAGMNGLALQPSRELFITLAEGGMQSLSPDQWRDTLPSSARILSTPPGARGTAPPEPYHRAVQRLVNDEFFPHWNERSDWRRYLPNGWILFGFGAQFLFFMRFAVQWYVSEKQKRVTVPVVFWYISIAGSLSILIYALRDFRAKDSVFVAGQLLACAIYVRNLMLIYRRRGVARFRAEPDIIGHGASGRTTSE